MTKPLKSPFAEQMAKKVLGALEKDDGPLGNLRDFHIKWMVNFTKWLFECPNSSITISESKKIYLVPLDDAMQPLSAREYGRRSRKGAAPYAARGVTEHLKISEFRAYFRREPPANALPFEEVPK